MAVYSDTAASGALYERYRHDLDEFVAGIAPVVGQVGAAFLLNGRFAGLDVLAGPDLLARLLPKLVRSYALDALDGEETVANDPDAGDLQAIQAALSSVAASEAMRRLAVGRGEDVRLDGGGLLGGALLADGSVVHLGIWASNYR
jgi:hypothetical protein